MKLWLNKRSSKWLVALVVIALAYSGYRIYKEVTMPPPLVFLIPEDYFGPVFFFFGQSDGVDVKPDPLGHAVTVPENGVIKLKGFAADLLPEHVTDDRRPMYMVSLAKNGNRKILIWNGQTAPNDNGVLTDTYLDENSKFHQFASGKSKDPFYYFTDAQKREHMVFEQGSCANQDFYTLGDPNGKAPGCGKFLVISPNEYFERPDWLWNYLQVSFTSIKQFENHANEVLVMKKTYYNLR